MTERTLPVDTQNTPCPRCGETCADDATRCPACGAALNAPPSKSTVKLDAQQAAVVDRAGRRTFDYKANAILQLVPSGVCLTLALRRPVTLGRSDSGTTNTALDLSDFNAHALGVSRRHCQLERQGRHLVLTDLGSANGTFLNGQRIWPKETHIVAHGDQIVLGKLRLQIIFSTGT
jgi:hypothetical protein